MHHSQLGAACVPEGSNQPSWLDGTLSFISPAGEKICMAFCTADSGGFSPRWSTPSAAQGPGQPRPMSRVGRPRRPWFAHRRRHEAKLHAAAHVVGCLLVPLRTLVEAVWQPHSAHTCRFQGREVTPSPTPYPSPGPEPEPDPDPNPNPNLEGAPRRVARYLLRPVAGVSYARR